ncbi:uncharacterized protein C9orf153 homolog [Mesocricetus auratus]|uniref:Uncharacterized protein C9orf153 homolog n=1 Tax=Mesocricetus auratus TaxID=10036 RepID=A0ABM2YBG8_MESAU|nr:uncharacterized protein C9orf153 homolog [Mesocricetus auratus]
MPSSNPDIPKQELEDSDPHTMSLPGHHTGAQDSGTPSSFKCSMSALYESAENFSKESKKSNFQKICGTSFEEARQLLGKNPALRKSEPLPAIQIPAKKEEQKPKSMANLLQHSLLMGSLVPLEQLSQIQQRLIHAGIPPPEHTFPYAFRTDEPMVTPTPPTYRKRTPSATFRKLLLASVTPDRLDFEDKTVRFFPSEAGKQFLDLVDLEWRYFKGLAKWGRMPRKFSVMDIEFTSEKRFVESQGMPGLIFPPLVRKTLETYPQVDSHKERFLLSKMACIEEDLDCDV